MTELEKLRLRDVAQVAHDLADTRLKLEAVIRSAHEEGLSYRTIAEAAGVSHEQVRRILNADA